MSDDMAADTRNGVSPTRKKVSAAILVVLLIVLIIEVRAGLGQSWSGNALKEAAPDEGVFPSNKVTMEEVESMMSLAPSKELVRESPQEKEYEYAWTSLLRPVMGQHTPALYVVMSNTEEPRAIRFGTDPPSQEELDFAARPSVAPDPSTEQNMDAMMGGSAPAGVPGDSPADEPEPPDPAKTRPEQDGEAQPEESSEEAASDEAQPEA